MPTARFFYRFTVFAHGTFRRVVSWSMNRKQRYVGKVGRVDRIFGVAMNDGCGANDNTTVLGCQINSLTYGSAGSHHVLHGKDTLPLPDGEPPAKLHRPIDPLTENGSHTQAGCDLLPDNDAAHRWRNDAIDPAGAKPRRGITGQPGKLAA